MRKTILFLSILIAIATTQKSASAQTVADAAREARNSKPQSKPSRGVQHKVYTNETLGASPSAYEVPGKMVTSRVPESRSAKTTALQWKAAIASQKNVVEVLRAQIEKTEKSIQFVTANGYSNGPQYNAEQKKRQDGVAIAKKRLEQEQQKLDEMKESARKEGFGSAVYDQ